MSTKYIKALFSIFLGVMTITVVLPGCKKLVDVPPPITSTNTSIVFENDASATAALTGIYTKMSSDGIKGGITSLSLFGSLSADDLSVMTGVSDAGWLAFYQNSLSSGGIKNFWGDFYYFIFRANSALEGLSGSTRLTPKVNTQLVGEAKFIRAFCYYYLVNLYGDVPLLLTTDYKKNAVAPRISKDKIYDQIILDLKEAQGLLSPNYIDANFNTTEERVSPTKWAATAMLSRTYLNKGSFKEAVEEASAIINYTSLYDTIPVNDVYLKNSKEAIWQLQSVSNVFTNTSDARLFLLPASGPNTDATSGFPVYLSTDMMSAFEPGDERKTKWTQTITVGGKSFSYPAKYKSKALFAPVTEHLMVLRLSEQYLIRSEAKIQLNDISGGINDLNILRDRARPAKTINIPNPLPPLPNTLTKQQALDAVLHEGQVEFFTEWGHRWLDLKRMGKINDVMSIASSKKGGTWQEYKQYYPILQSEFELNPSLVGHQNIGY